MTQEDMDTGPGNLRSAHRARAQGVPGRAGPAGHRLLRADDPRVAGQGGRAASPRWSRWCSRSSPANGPKPDFGVHGRACFMTVDPRHAGGVPRRRRQHCGDEYAAQLQDGDGERRRPSRGEGAGGDRSRRGAGAAPQSRWRKRSLRGSRRKEDGGWPEPEEVVETKAPEEEVADGKGRGRRGRSRGRFPRRPRKRWKPKRRAETPRSPAKRGRGRGRRFARRRGRRRGQRRGRRKSDEARRRARPPRPRRRSRPRRSSRRCRGVPRRPRSRRPPRRVQPRRARGQEGRGRATSWKRKSPRSPTTPSRWPRCRRCWKRPTGCSTASMRHPAGSQSRHHAGLHPGRRRGDAGDAGTATSTTTSSSSRDGRQADRRRSGTDSGHGRGGPAGGRDKAAGAAATRPRRYHRARRRPRST